MGKLYSSVTELIGKTPLLRLSHIEKAHKVGARLLGKLESMNPAGSSKDRVALAMIEAAEKEGALQAGGLIVEPTSGNTGIGLCMVAACRGYKTVLVMPENMPKERQALMRAYGAKVVLTPAKEGMAGAVKRAEEIKKENPGAFIPAQFDNPQNPLAHYETTARELYEDADGKIDVFVAGIGTGGTISGVGRYLKEKNPAIKIVGVEPKGSAVLSGKPAAPHGIAGIGAGFIPSVLDLKLIDEIVVVDEKEAAEAAKELARLEGVLCGISGGAALFAALSIAEREDIKGKTVAVLFPDTGERYLSTLYSE